MSRDIRSLTGLRGVAALYVCVYHLLGSYSGAFVQHGYLSVDLFFILSGFVISLSCTKLLEPGVTTAAYMTFLVRRIARVYPLYVIVTLIFFILMIQGLQEVDQNHPLGSTLVYNLLMIQTWGISGSLAVVTWSISTEWAAYLLFPFVVVLLLRSSGKFVILSVGFCYACIALICIIKTPSLSDHRAGPLDCSWTYSMYPLLRCCAEFYVGMATYWLLRREVLTRVLQKPVAASAVAIAILALLIWPSTDWGVVALLPLLILSLALGGGPVQPFLGSGPMHLLGELSYAIYLLHLLTFKIQLEAVQNKINEVMDYFPVTSHLSAHHVPIKLEMAVALLLGSYLAHIGIEKPCRRMLRRLEPFAVDCVRRVTAGPPASDAQPSSG